MARTTEPQTSADVELFGCRARNWIRSWYAASGCIGEDSGMHAVLADGVLVGRVTRHAVKDGPRTAGRALRVGIAAVPLKI